MPHPLAERAFGTQRPLPRTPPSPKRRSATGILPKRTAVICVQRATPYTVDVARLPTMSKLAPIFY